MQISTVAGTMAEQFDAEIKLPWGVISQVSRSSSGCTIEAFTDEPRTELTYLLPGNYSPSRACGFFDTKNYANGLMQLGSLVLRPGNFPLKVFTDASGTTRMITCSIDANYFVETTGITDWTQPMLTRCIDMQSATIAALMRNLSMETNTGEKGSSLAIESLMNLILVHVGRYFDTNLCASNVKFKLSLWQLRKIDEMLHECAYAWPSLSKLGEICGVSAKHLSRAFSASKGMPLGKYAEQIRIERACSLLTEAQLTIGQIADVLGFSSASYFSTAFHRATGMSPREFIHRQ